MLEFLHTGPEDADVTLLLAHGAGAAMDSAWMNEFAARTSELGVRTSRFEFSYMAARREGQKKPPPKAETLKGEYVTAVEALGPRGGLFVGGKSMGGRVASLVAGELFDQGSISGLVCLGYPFHPPGSPAQLRTAHLEDLKAPTLICHGTRDPFGTEDEVGQYRLSPAIELHWLADGDHDFRPRKAVSGRTFRQNLDEAAERVAGWMRLRAG